MGWWARLTGRGAKGVTHPEQLWLEVYGSRQSLAGVTVNAQTALQATVVLACARVLAEGVAQVPLKVYRAAGNGSEPATDHPLYRVLHRRPNAWQTSFEFRETLMLHLVLCGNAFAFVNRVQGRVVELLPFLPQWVTVKQEADYTITYEVRIPDRPMQTLPAEAVLHLRGPSWNSITGMDPVLLAREAIGLTLATEQHAAQLHGQGARPGGLLSTDQALSDEAAQALRKGWQEAFSGSGAFKTAVLDKGIKWTALGMTSVDAQHIETRRLQIEEICRAFRVSPIMVMQTDKASTFASAEQFFLAHVVHTLGPWYERWEESLDANCLTEREIESGLFCKFTVNGLLRGDATSRANLYSRGILDGWLTRNEARALEEMNPLPGLDLPLRPLNMGDGSKPPAPEQPKPAPAGGSDGPA